MRKFLRLYRFVKPHRRTLAMLVLIALATGGANGLFVLAARAFVDTIEFYGLALPTDLLIIWCTLIFGAFLLRGWIFYAFRYLREYLAGRVVTDARRQVFEKLLTQPMSYFSRERIGELMSRILTDSEALRRTVSLTGSLIREPISVVGAIAVAIYFAPLLGAIGFLGLPLMAWPMLKLTRRIYRASRKRRERVADLSDAMVQTFGGMCVVKAYAGEAREAERFGETAESIFRQILKFARAAALRRPLVEMSVGLGVVGALLVGGLLLRNGYIDFKDLAAFAMAAGLVASPIQRLAKANEGVQDTITGAERLYELLDLEPEMADATDATDVAPFAGSIRLRNVSFAYGEAPVLRDIDLEVARGECVAVVGPTGAGKSTLLDLVARFYDPTAGAVEVDGLDLRRARHASWLAQLAVVPQEPFLFNGPVRENILYGRPDASGEDVLAAAKAAAVHEEIVRFENGYETPVGERGGRVSGGQRQRIAIARALLRGAPVLLLDEATSSLDTESERKVQLAMERLFEDRTTLVVAHRLSTVQHADRIVVLAGGRVEAVGPHEELLERSSTYRRLHRMQQGGYLGGGGGPGGGDGDDAEEEA